MDTSVLVRCMKNVEDLVYHPLFGRITISAAVVVVTWKAVNKYKDYKIRETWAEKSKKKVILHQVMRSYNAPNCSPFCLKLETYLRMSNIDYEVDTTKPLGPRNKTPWVTVDGLEIGDSEFVINYFRNKYNKNFAKNLNEKDIATANACRLMLENHAFWGLLHHRYYECNLPSVMPMTWQIRMIIKVYLKIYKGSLYYQGFGRHSVQEMHQLVVKDLQIDSAILGSKSYFAGSEPCELDCAMFGFLAQVYFNGDGSDYERAVKVDYPNLGEYVLRMKEKFWPDWEQCLWKDG